MRLGEQGADGGGGVSTRIVALLTLAAFINYVDRGNLATAGPLIQDQLNLSHTELGMLLAAFFWSYAPAQLPAGWLAERFDPRWVLAAGLAIWGAATALTGGFHWALWVCGLIALSAVLVTFLLVRQREMAKAVAVSTAQEA